MERDPYNGPSDSHAGAGLAGQVRDSHYPTRANSGLTDWLAERKSYSKVSNTRISGPESGTSLRGGRTVSGFIASSLPTNCEYSKAGNNYVNKNR
jgi:hypothetical protein